jgi:ribonuclease HI
MKTEVSIIQSDGGARGNPGPAASAFVVKRQGKVIYEESLYLGVATNNQAEYRGVIIALTWLSKQGANFGDVAFLMDSELIVRQINGIYKVKEEGLQKLHREVMNLLASITSKVEFKHVPRKENKEADLLVNKELDSQ